MLAINDPCADFINQLNEDLRSLLLLCKLFPLADDSSLTREDIVHLLYVVEDYIRHLARRVEAYQERL